MKLINYLLIALVFVSSCKEEDENLPSLSKDYGAGIYIATDNGVSFYKNGVLISNIFQKVNGFGLNNVNKIKFQGKKAYIATTKTLFSANVETFENIGEASNFINLVDFDFVSNGRIFAVDRNDAKVKVVDVDLMEIMSDIETGDSTKPVFIVSNYSKSFVMNGGSNFEQIKDSTLVVIEHRYNLVSLANFEGSLTVGDNPNSAVLFTNGELKVLSQGIYDSINSINNTESSLSVINQYNNEIYSLNTLTGIYNANNLISDEDICYFTSNNGVYSLSGSGALVDLNLPRVSDVLCFQNEEYSIYNPTDSITTYFNRDVLYINDSENSKNTVYKYNLDTGLYIDTIVVDAPVNDIAFY
tara:strand:- start:113 stop:1183 length:1071 start_codon:yes stop_codon:yes gene_type:complete